MTDLQYGLACAFRHRNRKWESVLEQYKLTVCDVAAVVREFRFGFSGVDPLVFRAICGAVARLKIARKTK